MIDQSLGLDIRGRRTITDALISRTGIAIAAVVGAAGLALAASGLLVLAGVIA